MDLAKSLLTQPSSSAANGSDAAAAAEAATLNPSDVLQAITTFMQDEDLDLRTTGGSQISTCKFSHFVCIDLNT
jgi:hypothetical protein